MEHDRELQVSNLQLGDFVSFGPDPYQWATVTAVWDDEIEVTRPYLHTSDASYGAGRFPSGTTGSRLIPYTGLETFRILRCDSRRLHTVFRSTVPK